MNAINYFFKQIIDFVVPVHMKYLLSVATQSNNLIPITTLTNKKIDKDIFSTKDTTLLNGLPPGVIGKESYQNETTYLHLIENNEYLPQILVNIGKRLSRN